MEKNFIWDLMVTIHKDQKDKAGEPYIFHLERVRNRCRNEYGMSDNLDHTALLHDSLEDTNIPRWLIENAGGEQVAKAVSLLSRPVCMHYSAYIRRIVDCTDYSTRILAWRVKRADLMDNLDVARMQRLDPATRKRLCERYYAALDVLEGRAWS